MTLCQQEAMFYVSFVYISVYIYIMN